MGSKAVTTFKSVFRLLAASAVLLTITAPVEAGGPGQDTLLFGRPGWVLPGASVDMNFATGQYYGLTPGQLTVSRASSESEVCNGALTTFPPNVLAITPGCGAWVWEARTNLFLNNNAPATQTITVASGSVYTVSFYGTGTLTLTGAATQVMTGSAFPALTQYSFVAATTSLVATVTVLGAMQYPQVELNYNATTAPQGFATGPILTSSGAVTRAATNAISGNIKNCNNPSMRFFGTPFAPINSGVDQVASSLSSTVNVNAYFLIRRLSSGVQQSWAYDGTVFDVAGATSWSSNTSAIATNYANGSLLFNSFNKNTAVSASWASSQTFNKISLGSYGGQNPWNGVITRLAVACNGASLLNN